jgi:hypothetical protein
MVSLLVTVFLIQLACHLVATIGSKPIDDLVCLLHHTHPLPSLPSLRNRETYPPPDSPL